MSYIDSGSIFARLKRPEPPRRHRGVLVLFAVGLLLAQGLARHALAQRRRDAEVEAALARWEGQGGEHEPPVGGGIMD